MSAQNSAFTWQEEKLVLWIFLLLRASQNEWSGRHDGLIRLCVTAPPVDNQENLECVKFIAKSLKTAKTNVSVVRGKTSRAKTVEILKPDPDCWQKVLIKLVAN
jgi:uncharacterized protein YggU (UPF0235/DUF167 family)